MRAMFKTDEGEVRIAEAEDIFYSKVRLYDDDLKGLHYGLLINYTGRSDASYFIEMGKEIALTILTQILHTGFYDFTPLDMVAICDFAELDDDDEEEDEDNSVD